MKRYIPLCLIVGLLVLFRVVGSILPESQPNFQPLAALFFCGALLAPGWRGFAIPFGIWAITYPLGIGPVSSFPIFATTLLALAVMFFMGKAIASRGIPTLLVGSIAASLVFHLITNGAAWLGDPMYQKSLTGLWQSLWTGPHRLRPAVLGFPAESGRRQPALHRNLPLRPSSLSENRPLRPRAASRQVRHGFLQILSQRPS